MVKIKLKNGSEVRVKNGKWISADPELAASLDYFTRDVEQSSAYYPDFDEALALNVINYFGGKITYQTKANYVDGRIY